MRVAILGAGAVAFGNAAMLCRDGHEVALWSPSGRRTSALASGAALTASGAVEGYFRPRAAAGCADALTRADAVIIAVPGYGHRAVIEAAAPLLRDGQTVIFSSHLSLSALLLSRRLRDRGVDVPIAALGSTVTTGRQTAPDAVAVGSIRSKVDVAVIPRERAGTAVEVCRALFGDRFTTRTGLLAVALSNLNAQNHLAIALCNLTRMERGESWGQYRNITPAVARLIEGLDAERLGLAASFGLQVRTVVEHFRLSFGVTAATLAEMAEELASRPKDVNGPTTLETRYVTEDVPFGLVPTIRIGEIAGFPTPLHEAGVGLMSALYGRDFAVENDVLPLLGMLSRRVLEEA